RGNGGIRLPVLQLRQVPLRDSARSGYLGEGAPLGDSCVAKPDSQAHRVGRRTSHALLLEAMKQQMSYRKQGLTERARSRDRVTPTTGGPVGRERMDTTNLVIIVAYLVAMAGAGIWGLRRVRSADDFIVAGRRLGPMMYVGTLSAVVLGGASTIGGVGLGYQYGISGMWLVFMIGLGVMALGALMSTRLSRLGVYTVSEMLERRFGRSARLISAFIVAAYALMIAVTSTIAI